MKLAENKWKLEASSQMLQWWSWFVLTKLVLELTEKKEKQLVSVTALLPFLSFFP